MSEIALHIIYYCASVFCPCMSLETIGDLVTKRMQQESLWSHTLQEVDYVVTKECFEDQPSLARVLSFSGLKSEVEDLIPREYMCSFGSIFLYTPAVIPLESIKKRMLRRIYDFCAHFKLWNFRCLRNRENGRKLRLSIVGSYVNQKL